MNRLLFAISISFAMIIVGADQDKERTEWCIDSKFHKKEPSEEDVLHRQCEPWKHHSCCNEETTIRAHQTLNHYKFNYNHCPNHEMSEKCKKHFIQDLCFYECEPYVKPWVVRVNRSFASERIFEVPICASDCNIWWNDCQNDYTCVSNWARQFIWQNRTNQCPSDSPCLPINKIFTGAQQFCEMVWDHSWKYTTEEQPCMRIWFNGEKGNPNRETALYYASLTNSSQTVHRSLTAILYALVYFLIRF